MKPFIFLAFAAVLFSCKSNNELVGLPDLDYIPIAKVAPPGTVALDRWTYIDEQEVSNFAYLEYLYWIGKMFGSHSDQYKAALPDTLVWDQKLGYGEPYFVYFRHPAYRNYPAVGVTYDQATAYSKWRSDRVFEHLLVKHGVIEPDLKQDSSNYFTIERYFAGRYMDYKPDERILQYPQYRLPTREQWEQARHTFSLSTKIEHRKCRVSDSKSDTTQFIACADGVNSQNWGTETPSAGSIGYCKKHPVTHLLGNVREMALDSTITLGGGYSDSLQAILAQPVMANSAPQSFIGFRNVCVWVPLHTFN